MYRAKRLQEEEEKRLAAEEQSLAVEAGKRWVKEVKKKKHAELKRIEKKRLEMARGEEEPRMYACC